jgi:hypothetical protein
LAVDNATESPTSEPKENEARPADPLSEPIFVETDLRFFEDRQILEGIEFDRKPS